MHQFQNRVIIFLLVFLRRNGFCLDFCFNASLEGSRLNSSVLKRTKVSNEIDCIISCVQEPCCRSLNYMERLPQEHASLCEMLHDVIFDTSAGLQKNSSYDYVFITAPQKVYNERCTEKGDFDLTFESAENFTLLDQNVPKMSNMTLMFWMNTLKADEMTVFAYRTKEGAGEFKLKMKKERIMLEVQSLKKYFFIPPINDGYWHHVAVTWSLGIYSVSLDGTLVYSGDGLSSGQPLKADGVFVIESSFSGKLSQLNVWSDLKSATADLDINSNPQSCLTDEVGDVINWRFLEDSYHGCVVGKELISSCKPLRKNPDYDFIMKKPSSNEFNMIKLGNISSLEAFTITTWLKHEERTQYDSKSMEYVKYRSANGTKLVSLYFTAEYFILKIIGTFARKAKIPLFWNESPAYWHHLSTTWSSDSGHWKIYLDGSLVSIMHDVASNITFHAQGRIFLHGGMAHNSHQSRLNVWSYEIDGHALSLMANKGPLFENGNVFAWYGIKSKVAASTVFQETSSDLHHSRSVSVYQMDFPSASKENYILIKDVVHEAITVFSLCFWAKFLRTYAGVFVYSSTKHDAEIGVFLFNDFVLGLSIKQSGKNGAVISSHTSWHFYCLQWRNSDGLVQTYQDGKNLGTRIESSGYTIPSKGIVVLGQELDGYGSRFNTNEAFQGSLAGLNLWSQFLTANIIQGMASGVLNVNGNLFQWRNFRNHTFGIVTVRHGSEVEIPEYRVQSLRDKWCAKNITEVFTYARFVLGPDTDGYKWRCVAPAAMLDENMCYNITKKSSLYYPMDTNEDIFGNN